MNLVMDMRAGTATGAADQGDNLVALDGISPFFKQLLCVCVLGDHAMTVVDHDEVFPRILSS